MIISPLGSGRYLTSEDDNYTQDYDRCIASLRRHTIVRQQEETPSVFPTPPFSCSYIEVRLRMNTSIRIQNELRLQIKTSRAVDKVS
jgi:hypothetical protein